MDTEITKKKTFPNEIKILLGIVIVVILCGVSLAVFIAQDESASQTISTKNLQLSFDDTNEIVFADDIVPIYDYEMSTKATRKKFTLVKKTGSEDIYTKIKLTDIETTESMAEYDLKWALYKGTADAVTAGTAEKIATGNFGGKTSGSIVLATNQLISSTAVEYNLYIWISETNLDQSEMMGQSLSASIYASGTDVKENTLANKILTSGTRYIASEVYEYYGCDEGCVEAQGEEFCYSAGVCEGRNFVSREYSEADTTIYTTPNFTSTTDRGLFVQKDDVTKSEMGFPTYYYRGKLVGNYVNFADQVWRVLRINEDGSIKLISNGYIEENVVWNPNSNGSSEYVNANTNAGESDTIKDVVEDWYTTNIGNNATLDNKVVMSNFCNDRSHYYNGYGNVYYASHRVNDNSPIFICLGGANKIYSKVGLVTVDELTYNGFNLNNENSFIAEEVERNSVIWTLTPFDNDYIYIRPIAGSYTTADNTSTASVHAVINLSPDVIVTGGDGLSANTAYTIK